MAILVMVVEDEVVTKLSKEAGIAARPFTNQLAARFQKYLHEYEDTDAILKESDNQQVVSDLMKLAVAKMHGEYTFADVVKEAGFKFSSTETAMYGSMFAVATKRKDSKIVNLGKTKKVTHYINKMD